MEVETVPFSPDAVWRHPIFLFLPRAVFLSDSQKLQSPPPPLEDLIIPSMKAATALLKAVNCTMKNNHSSTKTKQRRRKRGERRRARRRGRARGSQDLFFLTRHLLSRSSMELRHDRIQTLGVTWGRPVFVIFGQSGKQIAGKTWCDGKRRAHPGEAPGQRFCVHGKKIVWENFHIEDGYCFEKTEEAEALSRFCLASV